MSEELLSLVEACKKGDKEAWGPFVKECGRRIRVYLWKPCRGKREEVDEITQRVWIKLLKGGLTDFRGARDKQFLAYLKKITINEANTHFRLGAKARKDISTDQEANPDDRGQSPEIKDEAAGLEEIVSLKEDVEKLVGCLKGLPLVQQEIAWMKAKDYKDSEIGEILGLPLGTVAVSYSRLKNKLRECMERA